MLKSIFIAVLLAVAGVSASAQNHLFRAILVDEAKVPLIGATVQWAEKPELAAVSNEDGWVSIERMDTLEGRILQIRYVGYDMVEIEILPDEDSLQLMLHPASNALDIVEVEARDKGNFVSTTSTENKETIKSCELKRAACCSLAESFETNATVNVSASDAVTGSKEIEMLGLRGTYVQMQLEGRPALNRLDRPYGMEFVPGSWIESIQISKGASSVRTGAQSIAGQINVELQKPTTMPKFYLNLYGNSAGRFELNNNYAFKLNERWSTALLTFGHYTGTHVDHNKDGFLDIPIKNQWNAMNRWFYKAPAWHVEFNLSALGSNQQNGQTTEAMHHSGLHGYTELYELKNRLQRYELSGKVGYIGSKNPFESAALIYSATRYVQDMQIGRRDFAAVQNSVYGQFIYQNAIAGLKKHLISTGLSYHFDDMTERFATLDLSRREHLAGAYAEYELNHRIDERRSFGLIAGARVDMWQSSAIGAARAYVSPRVNLKYNFTEESVVRLSAGRGVRQANALSENLRYMATYRDIVVQSNIMPEEAWNYGLNYTQQFHVGKQEASFSLDAYRTDFVNQLVADLDANVGQVRIGNSAERSYANSILATYEQDLFKGFHARVAYKMNDVRSVQGDTMRVQLFSPVHRGLLTAQYVTPKKRWQFDATLQYTGAQRLPKLAYDGADLPQYRRDGVGKGYVVLLAQVSHYFPNGIEVYVGGENLTNYRQLQPIIDAANPFGGRFDAASVYAPVMGAMGYVGLRYTPKSYKKPSVADGHGHNAHGDESGVLYSDKPHTHSVDIKTSAQCGMCKTTLETNLAKLKGVAAVNLDVETQVFKIAYTHDTTVEEIRAAISRLGYDADDVPADEGAYNRLPACCKKDGGHR